jgi:hypothetical protein
VIQQDAVWQLVECSTIRVFVSKKRRDRIVHFYIFIYITLRYILDLMVVFEGFGGITWKDLLYLAQTNVPRVPLTFLS